VALIFSARLISHPVTYTSSQYIILSHTKTVSKAGAATKSCAIRFSDRRTVPVGLRWLLFLAPELNGSCSAIKCTRLRQWCCLLQ